jgi:hypothetical protein
MPAQSIFTFITRLGVSKQDVTEEGDLSLVDRQPAVGLENATPLDRG